MEKNKIIYSEDSEIRIDKFMNQNDDRYSRSFYQKLITSGNIKVNSKIIKSNYVLKFGDEIETEIEFATEIDAKPENIDIDIIYEDDDIMVINKSRGMVVHPASGNLSGTLVNAILFHAKNLSGINGKIRPGIVHRIDKDTSGLLVIAKNDESHLKISKELSERKINRKYIALVHGNIKNESGRIETYISRDKKDRKKMKASNEGKIAITNYKVLEHFENYTLIECKLETGRTHQIRVHMEYIKHPLVGDLVYGSKLKNKLIEGQMLHAKLLGFTHPRNGKYVEFEVDPPEEFKRVIKKIENMERGR